MLNFEWLFYRPDILHNKSIRTKVFFALHYRINLTFEAIQAQSMNFKSLKYFPCLLLLLNVLAYSQDFEGKITFRMYYTPRDGAVVDTASLQKLIGSKSVCLMKKGAYMQTTDSEILNWQLYLPGENRLYFTDKATPDQLFYYRGDKTPAAEFTYEIVENAEIILGHVCNLLKYKSDSSEIHYYYAKDLRLNPKYFKDFSLTNKNKITQIMQSVFLRNEYYTPDFIAVMEAVEIQEMKIPDSTMSKPNIAMVREK
jgi:hypothetical protein